jgi:hypothetical protein
MNKIKLALIATAILVSIGGAFATRPCVQCEHANQYIPSGQGYVQVGEYGIDYFCYSTSGICTYYQPDPLSQPNHYVPCRTGGYTPVE